MRTIDADVERRPDAVEHAAPADPSVRRRHSRCSRFMPGAVELLHPARRPRAAGSPARRRAASTGAALAGQPRGRASRRRGACCTTRQRGAVVGEPAEPASSSSSCSAALPMRIGGFDQMAAKRSVRRAPRRARPTRTLVSPAAAALLGAQLQGPLVHVDRPHRGARAHARRQRAGRSGRSRSRGRAGRRSAGGGGRRRAAGSLVPGSTASAENTPRSVASVSEQVGQVEAHRPAGRRRPTGSRVEVVPAGSPRVEPASLARR